MEHSIKLIISDRVAQVPIFWLQHSSVYRSHLVIFTGFVFHYAIFVVMQVRNCFHLGTLRFYAWSDSNKQNYYRFSSAFKIFFLVSRMNSISQKEYPHRLSIHKIPASIWQPDIGYLFVSLISVQHLWLNLRAANETTSSSGIVGL